MSELMNYLDFACNLAQQAGRLTLGFFRRSIEVTNKSDNSPVTEADRQAEALIRREIEVTYPDHGILGEEFGHKPPTGGCSYTWVIDPIDGTKSFICGVPLYTTLLALMRDDESVIGVIDSPATGEQLSAGTGLGCRLNGLPVKCSDVNRLEDAVCLVTDPVDLARAFPDERYEPLLTKCRFVRTWADAYGYLLVASGRAEIMLDAYLAPHDCAGLPVVMRESGGAHFLTGQVAKRSTAETALPPTSRSAPPFSHSSASPDTTNIHMTYDVQSSGAGIRQMNCKDSSP